MRHHQYKPEFKFVKEPISFTKDTEKDVLAYCIGAMLYMPATKDFYHDIVSRKYPGLTAMTMCFEDACPEEDVPIAEENALYTLESIAEAKKNGTISDDFSPLIFFRVRNPEQFVLFSNRLTKEHLSVFSGFVFPKFCTANANDYFGQLKLLNDKHGLVVYGMPILEGPEIAIYETRDKELESIKNRLSRSSSFQEQVYDEIRFIAESEGYSMVLNLKENTGILWYSPTVDITDKLISSLRDKSGR